MTKPKTKAEKKVPPMGAPDALVENAQPHFALTLKPNPFIADKAADDYARFITASINHSTLRMAALEAAMVPVSNPKLDEAERIALQKANEAFSDLAKFTFVQCPYCHVPLHVIDNVHLANCPEVQKKYSGKAELWTYEQCYKDFPDIQTKSWLDSYVKHVSSVIPAPAAGPSPLPPRPAVVDKRKGLNAIQPKVRIVGQPIRVQPQVPAVVQRRGYVPPRFSNKRK